MKWKGCRRKQSLHNWRYYTGIRKAGENYINPWSDYCIFGHILQVGVSQICSSIGTPLAARFSNKSLKASVTGMLHVSTSLF